LDEDIQDKRLLPEFNEVLYFTKIVDKTIKELGSGFTCFDIYLLQMHCMTFAKRYLLLPVPNWHALASLFTTPPIQQSRCKDWEPVILVACILITDEADRRFIFVDCLEPIFSFG
jgi:hypothetical protein